MRRNPLILGWGSLERFAARRPLLALLAVHEAGHATAGVILGRKVKLLQVQTKPLCGLCRFTAGLLADDAELCIDAAGAAACELALPNGHAQLDAANKHANPQQYSELAATAALSPHDWTLLEQRPKHERIETIARAMRILADNWPGLTALALELAEQGTVDGKRVGEILAQ